MRRNIGVITVEIILVAFTVLFLLKVFGVNIPWMWVLSPIWVPALFVMVWLTTWIVWLEIKGIIEKRKRRKWH